MSKTSDLTQGKVSKLILGFFFPMLFTSMLQQVYSLADTAIVGKGLGDNAQIQPDRPVFNIPNV